MPNCPICSRSIVRVSNHLRKVHGLLYNTTQPSTLKEFIHLLKLFPAKPEDWEYLKKHGKVLDHYCKSDVELPQKLFQILYKTFDKYRSKPAPKLVILNGLIRGSDKKKEVPIETFEDKPTSSL
jgi:hypothetical protein